MDNVSGNDLPGRTPPTMQGAHSVANQTERGAQLREWTPARAVEGIVLLILLAVVCRFSLNQASARLMPAVLLAPLPFLLYAAVRFQVLGACLSLLVVGVQAAWLAAHGLGPFSQMTPADSVFQLLLFIGAVALPLIILTVAIQKERQARAKLQSSEDGLRQRNCDLIQELAERKQAETSQQTSEAALRTNYEQLKKLVGSIITAQEEERAHVARELHDNVNQQLAGLSLSVSWMKREIPQESRELQEALVEMQEMTMNVAEGIRHLSHELHSGVLKHSGLVAALKAHCMELSHRHGIDAMVTVNGDRELGEIPANVSLCLYRVAQEALSNIVKHSRSRQARLTLSRDETCIKLTIHDDGVGFDFTSARASGGIGLISMDERVGLINGTIEVQSQPQLGTEIQIRAPLRE